MTLFIEEILKPGGKVVRSEPFLVISICSIFRAFVRPTIYRMSQEEWTKLRESVPYVELTRCNPKHLYPKLNGYGDNGQRSLKL